MQLLIVWFSTAALVFGAVVHLNGALDSSEGEVWRGVLTSSGSSRGGPFRYDPVDVRWDDGSASTIRGERSMKKGDRLTERRHPGALGFEWFEGRHTGPR